MAGRRYAGAAAQHHLARHELAVVFAGRIVGGAIARIGAIGAGRPLPDLAIHLPQSVALSRLRMHVPEANGEVELRLHTSDVLTFWQVFINLEYDSPNLPPSARTIVDLGANIGLATQYFAARYPSAHIVAVEPDADNFALLMRNTAPLGTRVHRHHGAAWIHDGQISLRTEDEAQRPLGAWGTQVTATPRPGESRVPCYRLATLLDLAGFETVDILKVDIEGAELEVFTDGVQDCLDRIGLVIVETHDRFRPGSEAAVRNALGPQFRELPQKGENLFFARIT